MTSPSLRADLTSALPALGLALETGQIDKLLQYLELMGRWTKVYNLTAVRDPAEMLTRHLLDSLAAVAPLQRHLHSVGATESARVLDVGSGAGLPGIVLALCLPQLSVTCVDAVAKKVAFIRQAALALGLGNVQALHARVEQISAPHDVVCSRAFASLDDFVQWTAGALARDGVWMALKGKNPGDEIETVKSHAQVFHVEQLRVPGLGAERCVVWMRKPPAPLH